MSAVAEKTEYIRTHHERKRGFVVLPVVVTAAPLIKCELDEAGEVQLESATSLAVAGPWENNLSRRVYVMGEDAIPAFASALERLAERAGMPVRGEV